ncbi:hypothetical protein JCM6882_007662 [Rhodosporidiobolus microsporus]
MPALSDSPNPADPTLTPAERARAAALARAGGGGPLASSSSSGGAGPAVSTPEGAHSPTLEKEEAFNPPRADTLPFHRILDSQLLPNVSKPQLVSTLTTLHTLLSNILSPPNPTAASKYRQLRLSNALIKREIVDPANGAAQDFLVAAGFRSQNVEFTPYLVFAPSPTREALYKLRVARWVVNVKLGQAREAEAREKRYRDSEKEVEAARKEKALLAHEEDRRLRAEKDERDRIVRASRPAPDPSQSTYQVQSTGPSRWAPYSGGGGGGGGVSSSSGGGGGRRRRRRAPRGGQTMSGALPTEVEGEEEYGEEDDEGDYDDDDEEMEDPDGEPTGTDDPPPSYGELHGRVLGTGMPPPPLSGGRVELPEGAEGRGVRAVDARDVEEA